MPGSATLPIIDLAELDRGEDTRAALLERLRVVTHEIGFFHLAGHGIDERLRIASSRHHASSSLSPMPTNSRSRTRTHPTSVGTPASAVSVLRVTSTGESNSTSVPSALQ